MHRAPGYLFYHKFIVPICSAARIGAVSRSNNNMRYNTIMWHGLKGYLIYFLTGGIFTVLIVALEENGSRLLSGFATLMPVFTLVAYIFIGGSKGGGAVGQHAWFVLVGTIVSWVPYMILVAYLAPRIGPKWAIASGLAGFFILAALYLGIVYRYRLFGEA